MTTIELCGDGNLNKKLKMKWKQKKKKLPAYNNIPRSLTLNTTHHIPNSQVSPMKHYIPTSLSHPLLFFFITLFFDLLPYNNIIILPTQHSQKQQISSQNKKSFDTLITFFKETN